MLISVKNLPIFFWSYIFTITVHDLSSVSYCSIIFTHNLTYLENFRHLNIDVSHFHIFLYFCYILIAFLVVTNRSLIELWFTQQEETHAWYWKPNCENYLQFCKWLYVFIIFINGTAFFCVNILKLNYLFFKWWSFEVQFYFLIVLVRFLSTWHKSH